MSAGNARGSRRRRGLSDEMRYGSSLGIAVRDEASPGEAPRYGEAARVENHPLASDFIPRRKRVVVLAVVGVGLVATIGELLHRQAEAIAQAIPGAAAAATHAAADGLLGWTSALCLLAVALAARFVFSLRRHRVDDKRGRYRIWQRASYAALAVSLIAATGAHRLAAAVLSSSLGATPLADGCGWWLAGAAAIGGWMTVRMLAELGECRGGSALLLLASAGYTTAGIAAAELLPAAWGVWTETVARIAPLAAHALLLAAMLAFARYVLLDVQGFVERRPQRRAQGKKPAGAERSAPAEPTRAASASDAAPATVAISSAPRREEPASAAWEPADDEELDSDDEDDGMPRRKLSKAEKKKLRQQQRDQRRAA